MNAPIIDVVVRCRNEMPFTARTLEALQRQTRLRARILFLDDRSTDGSREEAAGRDLRILDVEPGAYVPGRVLNLAMRSTSSEIVAFVNADAIPMASDALAELIAPFAESPEIAATFGRQVARPDADPTVKSDYARAFGSEAPVALRHGEFFSMAASAVRRKAWTEHAFDETLAYSEDVEWSSRVRAFGWSTRYAPRAAFEHSHDYSLRAEVRRRAGEGEADARFHPGDAGVFGDLLVPLAGAVLRDRSAGILSPASASRRVAQAVGYFVGRSRGRT